MSADAAFTLVYELWICAVVLMLGLGPGIAILRACRLPAYCWLPVTLTASCLVAYTIFWIYFFDVHAGRLAAVVCWCASVSGFIWAVLRTAPASSTRTTGAMLRDRDAWLPGVLLLVLTTAYLVMLAAPDSPINYYLRHMPPDNGIPLRLANLFDPSLPQIGPRPRFLLADWLSSDRPPLQSAVLLAVRPFGSPLYPDLTDEAVGAICQLGWVVALYALARRLRLTRRQTGYALVGCACSAFFLTNSLYVWPKLLAGWLFVFAVVLILDIAIERRPAGRLVLLIAALFALSMLSHGGSLFALLALPVLVAAYRGWRLVTPLQAIAAAAVGLGIFAPWLAYQGLVDPPGNRLVKLHLAGVAAIDDRGTLRAIVDQYKTLTAGQYLQARWANVRTQFQIDPRGPDETWGDWIRRLQFFHHLAALDALSLGVIGLWWRRSRAPDAAAADAAIRHVQRLLLYTLAAVGVWCLLMFDPGATIVHHGGYGVTMLLFTCAAVGLAELPRLVRVVTMAAHLALFGVLWMLPRDVSLRSSAVLGRNAAMLVALVLLVAFAACLRATPQVANAE